MDIKSEVIWGRGKSDAHLLQARQTLGYCFQWNKRGKVEKGAQHLLQAQRALDYLFAVVGCFRLNGPLSQYFNLYCAVFQGEGARKEK